MEKKEIIRKLKEILSKHEGNTSEGAIYWDFEWVGGKQIPTGGGGYRQEGGKLVYKDKEFYQEMADFISQELSKAREEGREESKREYAQAIATGQKVELTEELVDRIWSANLEEMYKMGLTKLLKSKEDGK